MGSAQYIWLLSNNKLQISTITNNLVKHKMRHYATKYLFSLNVQKSLIE